MEKAESKKSGLATAGFVLGIIGICLSFIPIVNNASFFLGALAIIFGIVSLVKKASKGKAIVALVLGILSLVITIALQNSWSNSLDEVSDELDTMTGGNTEEVLKNVDVKFGKFEAVSDEYGFTETKLVVTVTNKTSEQKSFDFEIEAIDSDGNRITTDSCYASNLGAKQSQDLEIFTFVDDSDIDALKNATFKVVKASMY